GFERSDQTHFPKEFCSPADNHVPARVIALRHGSMTMSCPLSEFQLGYSIRYPCLKLARKSLVVFWAERVRSARVVQTSTFSAISRASSTSTPRYRTVLSIFEWPNKSCTARRLPVRR